MRPPHRVAAATLGFALVASAAACSSGSNASGDASASPDAAAGTALAAVPVAQATVPPNGPKIRIVTTDGTITAVLDPVHAPKTTANFLKLVGSKFFNGGSFFRAVPGFVIQGGNKSKEHPNDPTIPLEDPKTTHLLNVDGALAMARRPDPDSASSEFFIDIGPQPALDGPDGQPGYAVFGKVLTGMDVVRKIVALPAESQYLVNPVKIVSISRM